MCSQKGSERVARLACARCDLPHDVRPTEALHLWLGTVVHPQLTSMHMQGYTALPSLLQLLQKRPTTPGMLPPSSPYACTLLMLMMEPPLGMCLTAFCARLIMAMMLVWKVRSRRSLGISVHSCCSSRGEGSFSSYCGRLQPQNASQALCVLPAGCSSRCARPCAS